MAKPVLYLDTETFNACDIKAGTYRYAETAEILLATWAIDDGPVCCWDHSSGVPVPDFVAMAEGRDVVAHHAAFDRNVLALGNLRQRIPLESWDCTMTQALSHALPGSLDQLGHVLGLDADQLKIKEGKALIRLFCQMNTRRYNPLLEALRKVRPADARDLAHPVYVGAPDRPTGAPITLSAYRPDKKRPYITADGGKHANARPAADVDAARLMYPDETISESVRYTHETHPAEWARFVEYAKQDIVTLREAHRRLPTWNWQPEDRALYHLDQRINDRGFAVDMELAEAGVRAAETEKAHLAARFAELTGGLRPTQRAQVQALINERFGLSLDSTAKHAVAPLAGDATRPPELREICSIILSANKTSTAKYASIAKAVSSDGRFRGGLQFAGASRTRRWAGRIFQPQNLPSRGLPDPELIDAYIDALKLGYHVGMFPDLMLYGAAALRGLVTVRRAVSAGAGT